MTVAYDNINISNTINNLTSNLQHNLEEYAVEIRNASEVGMISTTAAGITDIEDLRFQFTNLENIVSTQDIRISEMEKQMTFLIKMFKKFEEINPEGEPELNVPAEAMAGYNLKNELKFK